MLRITFNNVGTGDSIILEWLNVQNTRQLGIIDCGKTINGENPAINYIKETETKRISFIILSHPHFDHYSGMIDLFEYCNKENIQIDNFYHTMIINRELYEDSSVLINLISNTSNSLRKSRVYIQLLSMIDRLYRDQNSILKKARVVDDDVSIVLNEGLKLSFLSPSINYEIDKYFKNFTNNRVANANLLSTVILIESENWQILLTSDATRESLGRIARQHGTIISTKRTIIAQVPHGGLKYSFDLDFWEKLKLDDNSLVVFSGDHSKYSRNQDTMYSEYFSQKTSQLFYFKTPISPIEFDSLLYSTSKNRIKSINFNVSGDGIVKATKNETS